MKLLLLLSLFIIGCTDVHIGQRYLESEQFDTLCGHVKLNKNCVITVIDVNGYWFNCTYENGEI